MESGEISEHRNGSKKVKEDGDLTQAAIASPYAAQCFGLQILKPHVFSSQQNSTRFIIVSKEEIIRKKLAKSVYALRSHMRVEVCITHCPILSIMI